MKRDYYLNSVNEEQALKVLDRLIPSLDTEVISVYKSIHRIPSVSCFAKVSSPSYNASAMDGIATSSRLTHDASETNPVIIHKSDYIEVNTGNVIPLDYDTVIMIEDLEFVDEGIKIIKSHGYFENIRPIGEDIVKGELVIPKYKKITPMIIGALLSAGITEIEVYKQVKVLIIPTGDEIIFSTDQIKDGQIIDSNSYFMKNALEEFGCFVEILPPTKDDYQTLKETIVKHTKEYDFLIIGAGSSAGSKDYTYQIIKEVGKLHVHGVNIKPGKPTIIGQVNETLIFGIPGYPVSTFISFHLFVKYALSKMLKQRHPRYQRVKAKLSKRVYSSLKNKEYVRVQLGHVNNELIATPLSRGASISMSLIKSDGLLIVDRFNEGYEQGSEVEVVLYQETIDTNQTLVSIGSHDIILDYINDLMNEQGFHLSSSHVGSFGGVHSIKNKECHIAPIHILHSDKTYNSHIIKEYLDQEYHLVEGIKRTQGLYVKKGNPKKIKNIKDLERVTFVNRQRGSGTRILLDQLLDKNGIASTNIKGYKYELSTHTQVAVAVLNNRYDTGLGIESVARRYDLDFIELSHESYDFLVHKDTLKLEQYKTFIQILESSTFKEHLASLHGYILDQPGRIIL